jgi:hypothetical protein
MRNGSMLEDLEIREVIQKLIDNGHRKIIEALLANESKVYTKKGRLNKSGLCRVLGWKTKQVEDEFEKMKELCKGDLSSYFSLDDEEEEE